MKLDEIWPRPWKVELPHPQIRDSAGEYILQVCGDDTSTTDDTCIAEYIVTCVNEHDALVARVAELEAVAELRRANKGLDDH